MKKSSLMFLYTNKCTAQCRHCCVEAGPQRTEKLSPELIKPLLSGFYDYGIREICFSGGEPLLFIDELEEISEEIKRIGFRQTVFLPARQQAGSLPLIHLGAIMETCPPDLSFGQEGFRYVGVLFVIKSPPICRQAGGKRVV